MPNGIEMGNGVSGRKSILTSYPFHGAGHLSRYDGPFGLVIKLVPIALLNSKWRNQ